MSRSIDRLSVPMESKTRKATSSLSFRMMKRGSKNILQRVNVIGWVVFAATSLILVLLYKAQSLLDSIEMDTTAEASTYSSYIRSSAVNILLRNGKNPHDVSLKKKMMYKTFPSTGQSKYPPVTDEVGRHSGRYPPIPPDQFLIFRGELGGQGMGNIISGLLAAHLLGLEFNRTVCAHYPSFFEAFAMAHPWTRTRCPQALNDSGILTGTLSPKTPIIEMINFQRPPDECNLQRQLLRSDAKFVVMIGNTYPRWPYVPDNLFFSYYQPKKELLDVLPFDAKHPPKIVVHLREPDDQHSDPRKGLDSESLQALGEALPSNEETYLVTNRVEWYDYFETTFHWKSPGWNSVEHSSTGQNWGQQQQHQHRRGEAFNQKNKTASQTLQMWADWYAMLVAEKVYHTHSDFSISAIHWMNKDSLSLQGMEGGRLKMVNESWRVDGETTPLVDRTKDGVGTSNLRACK